MRVLIWCGFRKMVWIMYQTTKREKKFGAGYYYAAEHFVGGGTIFKGDPDFIIEETEKNTGLKFVGFTVDARNKMDRLLMRKFQLSKYIFPYIQYIFKKV